MPKDKKTIPTDTWETPAANYEQASPKNKKKTMPTDTWDMPIHNNPPVLGQPVQPVYNLQPHPTFMAQPTEQGFMAQPSTGQGTFIPQRSTSGQASTGQATFIPQRSTSGQPSTGIPQRSTSGQATFIPQGSASGQPTSPQQYSFAQQPFMEPMNSTPNQAQNLNLPNPQGKSIPTDTFLSVSSDGRSEVSSVSVSDKKRKKSKEAPTDTFSLPLPDGYYRRDIPVEVPSHYTNNLLPEPSTLRYTAVNCGFSDFSNQNPRNRKPYTLRQQEQGKRTKIMIVVTMYNEDAGLFALTMEAVYRNIEYLIDKEKKTFEKKGYSPVSTEAGERPITWEDIVVCIICDGRHKCPQDVKIAMNMLGCYQKDELIMTTFQEDPVQTHLFEYTSTSYLQFKKKDRTCKVKEAKYPTQFLVCMKENNRKKIDSHGWAFRGFCPLLNPEVVVLLDMGTNPYQNSLYHFWKHFEGNQRLGGVCGEIIVDVEGAWFGSRWFKLLADPLLAAQNFEYKMSNILDKPLQSMFGYITVLPGAFSAYRYQALVGKPLDEYFKAENKDDNEQESGCAGCLQLSTANKYLAEDRILCFEIFVKKKEDWLLRYIRDAKATTDAPDTLGVFLNQRRRWLNGSLFAFLSAFVNMGDVFKSGHTFGRKLVFIVEMFYLFLDTLFSLVAPMNFFSVFMLSLLNIAGNLRVSNAAVYGLGFFYILVFIFGFIVFVGNNPRGSHFLYRFLSYTWMVIMVLVLLAIGYSSALLFQSTPSPEKVVLFLLAMLATYGLYLFSSIISFDVSHVFNSMLGYSLMLPTYINMMLPFALSNINDISWGNRPQEPETGRKLGVSRIVNGKAELKDTQDPKNGLTVDVNDLENELRKIAESDPNSVLGKKKGKPQIAPEDRNKNMRFGLLFVFFLINLLGSAAITYGAAVSQTSDPNDPQRSFNSFVQGYMIFLFVSICVFALIRFCGLVVFRLTTPKY